MSTTEQVEPVVKREHKDYAELIVRERKLHNKLEELGITQLPPSLENRQFWEDDFTIYLKELERFLSDK